MICASEAVTFAMTRFVSASSHALSLPGRSDAVVRSTCSKPRTSNPKPCGVAVLNVSQHIISPKTKIGALAIYRITKPSPAPAHGMQTCLSTSIFIYATIACQLLAAWQHH